MGGDGSGRLNKTDTLIRQTTSQGSKSKQPEQESRVPIMTEMFIPNLSGDHSHGNVQKTPTANTDIVNKIYVDNKFVPAGNNKEIQFNNSGAFGASSGLTWNEATRTLSVNDAAGAGNYSYIKNYGTSAEYPETIRMGGGNMWFTQNGVNGGIMFADSRVYFLGPLACGMTDGTVDIGFPTQRFQNLYLNGANIISGIFSGSKVISTGTIEATGTVTGSGFIASGSTGVSGSFTTVDLKTVTVVNGIITSIA